MTFTCSPGLTLNGNRCVTCGRWWAVEQYVSGTCPKCAARRIAAADDEVAVAHRTIAALRGALTKANRRAK